MHSWNQKKSKNATTRASKHTSFRWLQLFAVHTIIRRLHRAVIKGGGNYSIWSQWCWKITCLKLYLKICADSAVPDLKPACYSSSLLSRNSHSSKANEDFSSLKKLFQRHLWTTGVHTIHWPPESRQCLVRSHAEGKIHKTLRWQPIGVLFTGFNM